MTANYYNDRGAIVESNLSTGHPIGEGAHQDGYQHDGKLIIALNPVLHLHSQGLIPADKDQ